MHLKNLPYESGRNWIFTEEMHPGLIIGIGHTYRRPKDEEVRHFHQKIFECYMVFEGWMDIWLDGKSFRLEQNQVLLIEPGETHEVVQTSEPLRSITIKSRFIRDKMIVDEDGNARPYEIL